MSNSSLLRDQIERSAQRLAQLKAREIVSAQRDAARAREAERRRRALQRTTLGTILVNAGFGALDPAEVIGALLSYRELVVDPVNRERYAHKGAAWISDNGRARLSPPVH